MFGRRNGTAPRALVELETTALSNSASRLRRLEVEMVSGFEEWEETQQANAERSLLVEFRMSPWMAAAWTYWRSHRYGGTPVDLAQTNEIPLPDGWGR
jgi:hypothetical protein